MTFFGADADPRCTLFDDGEETCVDVKNHQIISILNLMREVSDLCQWADPKTRSN